MNEKELFHIRVALVQAFLRENNYDGILLSRTNNFAMATGGKRNYIYMFSDEGSNSLFITKDGHVYFVGSTIEEPRLMAEELGVLGCEAKGYLWFDSSAAAVARKEFTGTLVSDDGSLGEDVNGKLVVLRSLLTPTELEKYRRLGKFAAEAMSATLDATHADQPEADVAAKLIAEGVKRRCQVPVALVAADERIAKFRHPLPTEALLIPGALQERKLRGYVMVVGCFAREGLVASITRFKKVGDIDPAIPGAFARICAVDALMQEASVRGKNLGDVFAVCQKGYADHGFPVNEWHNHHQGGSTGYAGRTAKGTPGSTFPILDTVWAQRVKEIAGVDVQFGNAFAWNPSAVGVKSEDTFILAPDGTQEIVTATPQLPQVDLAAVLGRKTSVTKSGIAGA